MNSYDINDYVLLNFAFILLTSTFLLLHRGRNRRRYWAHEICGTRETEGEYATLFLRCLNTSHDKFFAYTRMEVWQFKRLLQEVKPLLLRRSKRALLPQLRLAITIKYLSHGGTMQSLAWNYRVGKSTAWKVVLETCTAIWEVIGKQYVKVPTTDAEWIEIADTFWNVWNFPNCIGAIDGKHVAINAPSGSGSEYFNYKGFHSVVLMAACDALYKFTWVDVGAMGLRSDGGIFGESSFGRTLMADKVSLPFGNLPNTNKAANYWFVADEAFPLKAQIMRPYPGRYLEEPKRIFNYRLSRARRVIENSFGILVARWRIFQGKLAGQPQSIEKIILATVALHNFLMVTKEMDISIYCPDTFVDQENNGHLFPGDWRQLVDKVPHTKVGRIGSNNSAKAAILARNQLASYFVSPEGEVPWQYDVVNRGWALN